MSDYKELLEDLRSKWLFPRNIQAADLIECLIRERDEARAKAIDEAAAVVTEHYQSLCQEHRLLLVNRAIAILALKDKPND